MRSVEDVDMKNFLETIEDMILIINREGRLLYANTAVPKKLGYPHEELMSMHILTITSAGKMAEGEKILAELFAGKKESLPLSLEKKEGTSIPAKARIWQGKWHNEPCLFAIIKDLSKEERASSTPFLEPDEIHTGISGAAWCEKPDFASDISCELKDEEPSKPRVLIVDDQLFNLKLLESALKEDYIVMTADNGIEALELATGKSQPDIILLDIIMPVMDGYEVCIRLREMPETRDIPVIFLSALKNEKNEEYALQLGVVDYITKPFSLPIIKGRLRNHVEQKKYRDRQKENSYIDELTQIANRRKFNETVTIEWNRARRNGNSLSVLMIDVDCFKKYNDFYGHLEGDKCLYKIAQTLKSNVKRSSDLVARWGGEEFACVLTDTDRIGAMLVGERLRRAVVKLNIPSEISDVDRVVTASIGVATALPSVDNSLEELLHKADMALYKAKKTGRNCVCTP
nr:diguanylate cyclase [Desulfitobacterium sp. LBE]